MAREMALRTASGRRLPSLADLARAFAMSFISCSSFDAILDSFNLIDCLFMILQIELKCKMANAFTLFALRVLYF